MKKVIMVVLVIMFLATLVQAKMVNTKGETMVTNIISQIYQRADNIRNNNGNSHKRIKDYVQAHPNQFDVDDKTKLQGLNAHIDAVRNAANALKAYIETEWEGIME